MRTADEYLSKASEFEAMATTSSDQCQQKRFTDIAKCYRLLAQESEWLVSKQTADGISASANSSLGRF